MDTELTLVEWFITVASVGAIAVLWKENTAAKKLSDQRHQKCETKHAKTQEELLKMAHEVGELKGRVGISEELQPTLSSIQEEIKALKSPK